MDLDHIIEDHEVLRAELARSESERAQAESTCERLQLDRLQHQRVETGLRAELFEALAARQEAETSTRLAVSQIAAMKEIWTHTQTRLEEERGVREVLRVELAEERLDRRQRADRVAARESDLAAEIDARRAAEAARDQAQSQCNMAEAELASMKSSRAWTVTRPLRMASSLARRVRARVRVR